MRKHLLGLMLIAGMAGCTSESDVAPAAGEADALARSGSGVLPTTAGSLAAARGASTSFAALPDRGELLAYGGARKVRTSGAYTWHPVSLSEAHALNSIGTGRLVVNTPDGESLALKYQRHEEQPDGNWTWIGRNDDGSSAVLTFGEKAVFGTIARGDTRYRVRTDRTGAWVVETDPRLAAANGGRPADGNDTLLPPEGRALMAAASRQMAKSGASKQDVPGKAGGVIDLLVGYSSTIATELGSQNAAITLMSNLTTMANAAYADSGVNMRLRLVHAMSVNYADGTSNNDALRQLTGYNDETQQPITPNAAFNALRAARNEYGADLVAFVRRYREPEQEGCGVAWLLGGNQSSITGADEAFGYAVVSDGEDVGSGNNVYFCSDYSLAHELGHLMGQAHDQQNAREGGAHTYSYGYREASPTGFFTIMAYPAGDGQLEAPVFANPAIRYGGRPAGTAAADNVRSMNQTMPIIATFRAAMVPLPGAARNDVDVDGKSDILFHNAATRQFSYRVLNGTTVSRSYLVGGVGPGYRVVATGDFNGDGRVDLVWSHPTNRDLFMWQGNGTTFTSTRFGDYPAGWTVVGAVDVNNDGRADLLFHNATTRQFSYRIMNGTRVVRSYLVGGVGNGYTVAATGDFNGDGFGDIVWTHPVNRDLYMWVGNGNTFTSTRFGTYPPGWVVSAAIDINGDGRSDLLFHNASARQFSYRIMNGLSVSRSHLVGVGAGYTIATVGDFNGDGLGDVVWTNPNNRDLYMWTGNGSTFRSAGFGTYPSGWGVIR
ncbi:reprolysin-like metallopeptidase [Luteimonas sp. SDU101]|uniref:reprolysin-like metallopeptidase n=1 Tax=Luteimonas sp. SDU101 TaxID=3422593 RepID=UPI003EBC84F4